MQRSKLLRLLGAVTFVSVGAAVTLADSHGGHAKEPSPAAHGAPAPAPTASVAVDAHGAAPSATLPAAAAHAPATGMPADEAIKKLTAGNDRFVAGTPARPNQNQSRLCDTFANGQHPFAGVLSCADSRVPPELIFDTGIGDLFVVRIAGNVADVDEVGSLEYAVEHLGINLIVVMGHAKCGAVTAVVDKAHVTPNIEKLVDNIAPAADEARKSFPQLTGPRLVEKAIRANVRQSIADLSSRSELLREKFKSGKLKAIGCVYNLHTGEADWLEPSEKPVAQDAGVVAPGGTAGKGGHGAADEHAAPKKDPHGDPHSAVPAPADGPASPESAKEHNFVALGGLLGGGAAVSYAIIHLINGRRS
ncbi:carbonic anhydrase [Humisphaera borealis]|uniref:carbonic anhydrase n=1 Tax=Humisphaera borealis TaxID=2807512 RepID=A0A7M2WRQ5_9BACT|nr:carbonic anhydrase [Humisphaera borealis]QOV87842.1 carbonic anhydrase [Humisphaera borealis]